MREISSSLTPTAITGLLQDTAIDILARNTGAATGAGFDSDSGAGLIDAEQALASMGALTDNVGFWRPSDGDFRLDANGNDTWDGPSGGDTRTNWMGSPTDTPVSGDFNADGVDEVGFWRPSDGDFRLDTNGNGTWDGPSSGDTRTTWWGASTDIPVTALCQSAMSTVFHLENFGRWPNGDAL